MRTCLFIMILFCIVSRALAQQDTLRVKGHRYLQVKQAVKNDFAGKDTLMKLYRIEHGVKTYLLTHYMYRYSADCNNTFQDLGKVECRGDSMIFETSYFQKGHDPIPEKQKQIYKVGEQGRLFLVSDRIYLGGKWMNAKDMFSKAAD